MNPTSASKPFSAGELAAGIAALAAVALIACVGLRVPRQRVSAPAEPSGVSNTVVPGEQFSKRDAIRKSEPVSPASAEAGSTSSTPLPASTVVASSGSAAAPSPTPSADPMPAPPANPAENAIPQIAGRQHASADQVPAGQAPANPAGNATPQVAGRQQASADQVPADQAPTQQPTWTDLLLAPPTTNRPSRFEAPVNEAAAPVAGPVPLPRKRPHPMAFAEAAIPLPQPRPDSVGPERPPAGLDWLGGIFQSSPSSTVQPEPVHQGDY